MQHVVVPDVTVRVIHAKWSRIQFDNNKVKLLNVRTMGFNAKCIYFLNYDIYAWMSKQLKQAEFFCVMSSPLELSTSRCCPWGLKSFTALINSCSITKMSPSALVGL